MAPSDGIAASLDERSYKNFIDDRPSKIKSRRRGKSR